MTLKGHSLSLISARYIHEDSPWLCVRSEVHEIKCRSGAVSKIIRDPCKRKGYMWERKEKRSLQMDRVRRKMNKNKPNPTNVMTETTVGSLLAKMKLGRKFYLLFILKIDPIKAE